MNLSKKFLFPIFTIFILTFSDHSFAQVSTISKSEMIPTKVEFTINDIEKIKTLLEHHFKTRISDAEMTIYGKASKENLELSKPVLSLFVFSFQLYLVIALSMLLSALFL